MTREPASNFGRFIFCRNHIKHSVVLFFLILLGVQSMQAQNINWGIKGGMNFANYYDAGTEANRLTRFSAGAFANVGFDNVPLSLQPEILYTRKGSNSTVQVSDYVLRGNFKTAYVEFPLLLKYSVDFLDVVRPRLFAGPTFSYLLSSKFKNDLGGDYNDMKSITNETVWGAVGGLEIMVPALSDRLSLEARFSRGYSDIYKKGLNPEWRGEFNRPQKDYVFSILVNVEF